MEPLDPLSQLASCCFGRRARNGSGFKTAAMRNQYLYSPSMAHMTAGGGGWPMTASGIPPTTIISGGLQAQLLPTQPYILLSQPVIVNSNGQLESLQAHNTQGPTLAILQQQQQQQQAQMQAIQAPGEPSPLHKVPSMLPSQYNIYATTEGLRNLPVLQHQQALATQIYGTPVRQYGQPNGISRNVSTYLNQQRHQQQPRRQQQQPQRGFVSDQHQQQRRLSSHLYKRLEIIEKQVDLSEDMDLVERHGIVITRHIEPITLAPHLTNEMLASYQNNFLLDGDHVIKFIEIIKRPGQTLGLYIRAVHFENPLTRMVREGVVITKIESDSPVYTSRVLHIGDEILSINLIDIQGMVLDDVVTLMSIPKRLVLVLRIPKGRLQQELTSELLEQDERQQEQHQTHQKSGLSQMLNQHIVDHRVPTESGPRNVQSQTLDDLNQRLAQISEKQSNFEAPHCRKAEGQLHLARPARVLSAKLELLNDEMSSEANFSRVASELTNESRFLTNSDKARQSANMSAPVGSPHVQGCYDQPRSPGFSRLDRQIAISQSIDIGRNEDLDMFCSYSMDPEIAKLERDALTRDKPNGIESSNVEEFDERDRIRSYSSSAANISKRKVDQTTSTLPRRTLPTRPDLVSSTAGTISPVSAANSSIISNIRLGETPEQTNYFTSSIDAINRELKELRRQRLAMSPCNESAATDASAKNPALNLE